jgi:hypothetical protein
MAGLPCAMADFSHGIRSRVYGNRINRACGAWKTDIHLWFFRSPELWFRCT